MLKRVLHAANQVVTHPETHTGRGLSIERTVNDKVDLLRVGGDSWQEVTKTIPNPDYPSEIRSVGGELICITKYEDNYPCDRYRGSQITLPELPAIRDNAGNIVAQDVLWVDRKQRRAWVERHTQKIEDAVFIERGNYDVDGSKLYAYHIGENYKEYGKHIGICNKLIYRTGVLSENANGFYIGYEYIWARIKDVCDLEEFNQKMDGNIFIMDSPTVIEELPYTDYLLSTAQYQTNIRFIDLDEHLKPEITAIVKILGR